MVTNPALQALGCHELVGNRQRSVVIHEAAVGDFDALDERKKARLIRIMELWIDGQRLTEEQFNGNEGREQKGDINVLIQAFKTHKVRLYGVDERIDGKRTFAILEIDSEKKQNKADPKILKKAKSKAIDLVTEMHTLAKKAGDTGRKK